MLRCNKRSHSFYVHQNYWVITGNYCLLSKLLKICGQYSLEFPVKLAVYCSKYCLLILSKLLPISGYCLPSKSEYSTAWAWWNLLWTGYIFRWWNYGKKVLTGWRDFCRMKNDWERQRFQDLSFVDAWTRERLLLLRSIIDFDKSRILKQVRSHGWYRSWGDWENEAEQREWNRLYPRWTLWSSMIGFKQEVLRLVKVGTICKIINPEWARAPRLGWPNRLRPMCLLASDCFPLSNLLSTRHINT